MSVTEIKGRRRSRLKVRSVATFKLLVGSADEDLLDEISGYLEPFGYGVIRVTDGLTALELVRSERPDLVISEVELPPLSGYELGQAIKQDPALKIIPFLLIADSDYDSGAKVKGLAVGADDLLYRPLHELELRARVRSSLRNLAYMQQLLMDRGRLEQLVSERTKETEQFTLGLVAALEQANQMNDTDTGTHVRRVSGYSAVLAQGLNLEPSLASRIERYASLHDVGKVGLPDSILKKEGTLTLEERELMQTHTTMGFKLLRDARADEVACNIALYHHEKFDASGYPRRLPGNQIPIEARIVALADVYDALTTRRCYKKAMPQDEAYDIVRKESGKHFDPGVVRIFFDRQADFLDILGKYGD